MERTFRRIEPIPELSVREPHSPVKAGLVEVRRKTYSGMGF
ncbi:MAG: hypothetical protein ACI3XM_11375 [Eubacteriales bacterium]